MMDRVYNKARSKGVGPEVRAAMARASVRMETERFLKELDDDLTLVDEGEVGSPGSPYARRWLTHCSRASDFLAPDSVSPLRGYVVGLMGKRVWASGLAHGRKRVLLRWGSGQKVALRAVGSRSAAIAGVARARAAALPSDPVERRRVSRSPVRGGMRIVLFAL